MVTFALCICKIHKKASFRRLFLSQLVGIQINGVALQLVPGEQGGQFLCGNGFVFGNQTGGVGQGANESFRGDALAEHADSPEIKYLLLNAGVGILAEELGLYNNKEEIYDEYISALALLSSGALAEDELCAAIKDLNDMYAIPMSDAECAALASSLIAHPYAGEGDPSLALPTTTYPTFSMLASTGTPTVTLLGETDAYAAWLAQLFEAVPETEKEAHFDRYVDKFVSDWGYDRDRVTRELSELVYESMLYDKTTEYLIVNNEIVG